MHNTLPLVYVFPWRISNFFRTDLFFNFNIVETLWGWLKIEVDGELIIAHYSLLNESGETCWY